MLVKLHAGGICGSDLPSFLGKRNPFVDFYGSPGFPLHEVVGEVVDGELPVGTRVVGWAEGHLGLAEYFVARVDNVLEIDDELSATDATVIQPLCTVLHALDRLRRRRRPARRGARPGTDRDPVQPRAEGARGAGTGVDRIDRRDLDFGVDEVVWGDAADWAASLGDDGPEIVIEAIGHQAGTLEAAVEAVAPGGVVLAFGVPDETHYSFPFSRFFRKNATLIAGVTTDRRNALAAARDYLREHRDLLAPYVTDVFAVDDAQAAFERAVTPTLGRLKVVLDARVMDVVPLPPRPEIERYRSYGSSSPSGDSSADPPLIGRPRATRAGSNREGAHRPRGVFLRRRGAGLGCAARACTTPPAAPRSRPPSRVRCRRGTEFARHPEGAYRAFEAAADAVVGGDLAAVESRLNADLVHARSRAGTTRRCCTMSPRTAWRTSGRCRRPTRSPSRACC